MPCQLHAPVAFRCRNCGQLVTSEHAGENLYPHACPVCRAGVDSEVIDKARFSAIVACIANASTPDAERQRLAKELADLPRERVYHPENWESLGEVHCPEKGKMCEAASAERLAELQLTPDDIAHHKPKAVTVPRQGRFHKVGLADGVTVKDGV